MLDRVSEAQGVCIKASNTWLKGSKCLVSSVLIETCNGSIDKTYLGQKHLSALLLGSLQFLSSKNGDRVKELSRPD